MVDLAFGRGVALLVAVLIAGCAARPEPVAVALAPIPEQASNALRRQMSDAIQSGDHVALTRAAVALMMMGGGMSDRGFDSFSDQLDPGTLSAMGFRTPQAEALRARFHVNVASNAPPAQTVAMVPAEYKIVEGIAYDRAKDRLFIGTVVDGRLAYLDKGAWHEIPLGFPRSGLFGMAIDPRHRLLWISTGMVDETAVRDQPFSGLIAVDLDRLTVIDRIAEAGEPGVPGDVTVARDGAVFMSDSKNGAVQMLVPGEDRLRMLVPPGRFKSPQGMALSADQRTLYVADYSTGLWYVRLSDGKVMPMRVARPTMLDGIDGLIRLPSENALVATQNGTSPRSVTLLNLSPDGHEVTGIATLEMVPPTDGDPSLMTLTSSGFWFVGDGQWERYGPRGVLKDGKPPRPTPILETVSQEVIVN